MTSKTHIAFYAAVSNMLAIPILKENSLNVVFTMQDILPTFGRALLHDINYTAILAGLLGSFLPDVSNSKGSILRHHKLNPIAIYIEQRWGHRTVTHSAAAIILCCLFCAIYAMVFGTGYIWCLALGVGMHILLDMMNISGVRFFAPWDNSLVCVIPYDEQVRIPTNSKRESRLYVFFLIMTIITLPFGLWGYEKTYRAIAGSHTAAVEEYKSTVTKYELSIIITDGVNRITQEPVHNRQMKVIAVMPQKLMLVEDEEGKRFTVGQAEDAIIDTKKMQVIKGVPVETAISEIKGIDGWEKILGELQHPYSYAIGALEFAEDVSFLPEVDRWEGIKILPINKRMVEVNYAGFDSIKKLAQYTIVGGGLKIRKEMSREGIVAPLREEESGGGTTRLILIQANFESLLIKEGERIEKDSVIARDPIANKYLAEISTTKQAAYTKSVEEDRAKALQDRSLEIARQIHGQKQQIATQEKIVASSAPDFKKAEQARLDKLNGDLKLFQSEQAEIQRSLQDERSYINRKKSSLMAESNLRVKELEAQIAAVSKKSPYAGTVRRIKQRSANMFEIIIVVDPDEPTAKKTSGNQPF